MSRTGDWFMRVHGDHDDDDGYSEFEEQSELDYWRGRAEQHILEKWFYNANLELESVNHHHDRS